MKKLFDGVLLASDFDGTLANSRGVITENVRRAIGFFVENGGRFTVCTGRTRLGFRAWSPELMNAPVLLANGGMAYDYAREEVCLFDGIGDEGIEPLRAVMNALPRVAIELYPLEKSYSIHPSDMSRRHFTSQGIPFDVIGDPADAPRPWAKAMLGGDRQEIAKAQEILAGYPEISFLPTEGEYLEILKKGVDKGTALLKLADRLGVAHAHTYAVGDGYNDVEMLRAAALAFVPANGDAFARACAGAIVPSNDQDALAHVIDILRRMYERKPS